MRCHQNHAAPTLTRAKFLDKISSQPLTPKQKLLYSTQMNPQNLFDQIPESLAGELFDRLVETPQLRIERILSRGHSTPPGQWYDQDWHEWVILLTGSAGLLFEGEAKVIGLKPGEYVNIPAHQRHRVEWTDSQQTTVWLAIHYK